MSAAEARRLPLLALLTPAWTLSRINQIIRLNYATTEWLYYPPMARAGTWDDEPRCRQPQVTRPPPNLAEAKTKPPSRTHTSPFLHEAWTATFYSQRLVGHLASLIPL
ncbi:hypothetical protein E2C01_007937 [Portunus trituberculatus]|uniref:Uncharacterized protein n=1 Tax=Portunus trituberculatus TaxID=210409 RepID=A0A5B7D501_PORTR|nr:hypothetical protein [Portunus trituberculatus]